MQRKSQLLLCLGIMLYRIILFKMNSTFAFILLKEMVKHNLKINQWHLSNLPTPRYKCHLSFQASILL